MWEEPESSGRQLGSGQVGGGRTRCRSICTGRGGDGTAGGLRFIICERGARRDGCEHGDAAIADIIRPPPPPPPPLEVGMEAEEEVLFLDAWFLLLLRILLLRLPLPLVPPPPPPLCL